MADTPPLSRLVSGISANSRAVTPGGVFVAIPGTHADGRQFIPEAVAAGARIVLAPPGTAWPQLDQPYAAVETANPRRSLALLAAHYHAAQPGIIAAVTGTNGKTSVARFTEQIWRQLGHLSASIGTLGVSAPTGEQPGSLTTPDPVALHRILAGLAGQGVERLALEASSHGLDQHRLDGVRITIAGFTNLSRDHLDYHGSEEAYFTAKARLFDQLVEADGTAVINADDPRGANLIERCRTRHLPVIDYGRGARGLRLTDLAPDADGLLLTIETRGRSFPVKLPLIGLFQAENALCALGMAIADEGTDIDAAIAALGGLQGVPGRLERVGTTGSGGAVYVDYAHTPDGLEAVLTALRPHCHGRLHVVFGAGGDRDPGKRAPMGAVAARLADTAIVTDDNPRDEDPAAIRQAILQGAPDATEIGDRADAIRAGIDSLQAGDILVIAGKGHETGQIVGGEIRPFDDRAVARELLAEASS